MSLALMRPGASTKTDHVAAFIKRANEQVFSAAKGGETRSEIPLPSALTETVKQALAEFFTRIGFDCYLTADREHLVVSWEVSE